MTYQNVGKWVSNAPTGLYGHVQSNRQRSLLLFGMFAVAVQLLMFFGLTLPLLLFDPARTPIFHPLTYAMVYGPIAFIVSGAMYGVQMWWFVSGVRTRTNFCYVSSRDEPRLCRILEPLATTAGVKMPHVAVIDTSAMNAFAVGVRENHMVAVATRGLIDGLNDAELAGVLANVIVHIRNRDTRLMAAATIFMRNMTLLYSGREAQVKKPKPIPGQVLALVIFPIFVPLTLIIGFCVQVAFRIAYSSRALIGTSRELMADADAVRLTQDPGALVSALQKMERNAGVDQFGDENAAMLVVGVSEGELATHPTIDERIEALARTTGSMVLDTAPRLDTRDVKLRQRSGFGRRLDQRVERIAALGEEPARRTFWTAFKSAKDPERNIFGLDHRGMKVMLLSVGGICLLYANTFTKPDPLPKLWSAVSLRGWEGTGAIYASCVLPLDLSEAHRDQCEQAGADAGKLFGHLPLIGDAMAHMETPKQEAARETAESIARGCYDGRWDEPNRGHESIGHGIDTYLRFGPEGTAELVPGPDLDEKLRAYASMRLTLMEDSLYYFGESGLMEFNQAVEAPNHRIAMQMLAERVKDPKFLADLTPWGRAGITLLSRKGSALRPCWSTRPFA